MMALTKEKSIDQITVTENGIVLVREVTRIVEDGAEISKSYHRLSYEPGQDITSAPENVQAICAAAWTPAVVDAYRAA
jgi:hypothetical protein